MTKKISIVLVILLLTVCLFSACTTENYTKEPLTGDTSGEVTSNGGLAVQKGDYLYFVNGARAATENNTYGEVLEGAIVRVLVSQYEIAIGKTAGDLSTLIEDKNGDEEITLADACEVVVPKIFYNGYTANKDANGFYIYGDRLYYTTPDVTIDKNGLAQSSQLCVMSCKLDGTDTVKHCVIKSNTLQTAITELNNEVYVMYVEEGKLYNANISATRKVKFEEISAVGTVMFNSQDATAYFVNADQTTLSKYVAGGTVTQIYPTSQAEDKMVVEETTITMKFFSNNQLFIQLSNSVLTELNSGIYRVAQDNTVTKIQDYIPGSYYAYGNFFIATDTDKRIVVKNITDGSVVKSSALSGAPTFITAQDGYIYYTISNLLYRSRFAKEDGTAQSVISSVKLMKDSLATSGAGAWATYDIIAGDVLYFYTTSATIATGGTVYPIKVLYAKDKMTETDQAGKDITCYTVVASQSE